MLQGFRKETKKEPRKRLGEILLDKGLLTDRQVTDALKKAHQSGIRLGAALTLLGYVSEEQILTALSESLHVPSIDMSREVISVETQERFPYDLVRTHGVVPVRIENNTITIAMMDPTDHWILEDIRFRTNTHLKAVLASSHQIGDIMKFFEQNGYGRKPYNLSRLKEVTEQARNLTIIDLLKQMVERDGSDLHLTVGAPPSVRTNNRMVRLDLPVLDVETVDRFANDLLTDDQKRQFVKDKELEITYRRDDVGRFRVGMYRQRRSISIAVRNLRSDIPHFEDMGFPEALRDALLKQRGLVLVTSPAGHGKSTTVASLVDFLNRNVALNIITLEDPIEFLHKHKNSNVNQREIGVDTDSFPAGLRHILRQNPDVIVIGELRDAETIAMAVHAAATGQLVISSMHATSTISAIDTVMNSFTGNELHVVRQRLADALLFVIAQRLIPRKSCAGRALAAEILLNSPRVSAFIRDGKPYQIRAQSTAGSPDMLSLEACLADLCRKGIVHLADARRVAENEKILSDLAGREGRAGIVS